MMLVDTPGFSDPARSDTEILGLLVDWMKESYGERQFSGVAGDEMHCLPGGSRIYGNGLQIYMIHDGSTPGGKVITRCITPDPATSGLIYLHDISGARMTGSILKNLRMFRTLCGEENLRNVTRHNQMGHHAP